MFRLETMYFHQNPYPTSELASLRITPWSLFLMHLRLKWQSYECSSKASPYWTSATYSDTQFPPSHSVIGSICRKGPHKLLSSDDSHFMIQMLQDQPGLFLSEISEKMYDGTQVLMSLEAIHNNLINQLLITLKKADTVNSRKCLISKFTWVRFSPCGLLLK
ncbi:hypothetical protein VP01_733g7 [Puccinia sorghi]|uniref:Uncharacterized protein n=1 Tax=Puccinia sorghi TaxID=27349 RepID=A0A0L6UDQ8_9BASI|nr:hypothetical protein VP01_733g7 [Puccinia sorghi]